MPPSSPNQRRRARVEEVSAAQSEFVRLLPGLTPIIVLALGIIGYVAFLRPLLFELRTLHVRAAVAADEPALRARLANLVRAREAFGTTLSGARPIIDAAMPADPDIPGILTVVAAAAQRSGMEIGDVETAVDKTPEHLKRVLQGNVVVLVETTLRSATYEKLKVLFRVLAQSGRLVDVLSVQFIPEKRTANLRLRAYTFE